MSPRDEAHRWLFFAEEDSQMADLAYKASLYAQACFHAQQCTEKSIKALIAFQGKLPPRSHRLIYLLSFLEENPISDRRTDIGLLDLFYTPTRYPDAIPGSLPDGYPSPEIASRALNIAQDVYQRIKDYILSNDVKE